MIMDGGTCKHSLSASHYMYGPVFLFILDEARIVMDIKLGKSDLRAGHIINGTVKRNQDIINQIFP